MAPDFVEYISNNPILSGLAIVSILAFFGFVYKKFMSWYNKGYIITEDYDNDADTLYINVSREDDLDTRVKDNTLTVYYENGNSEDINYPYVNPVNANGNSARWEIFANRIRKNGRKISKLEFYLYPIGKFSEYIVKISKKTIKSINNI